MLLTFMNIVFFFILGVIDNNCTTSWTFFAENDILWMEFQKQKKCENIGKFKKFKNLVKFIDIHEM